MGEGSGPLACSSSLLKSCAVLKIQTTSRKYSAILHTKTFTCNKPVVIIQLFRTKFLASES